MGYDSKYPWAVRKTGVGGCASSAPYCGYTPAQIKSMQQSGYILTFQGKRVKAENAAGNKK